jgi:hypothetical protein
MGDQTQLELFSLSTCQALAEKTVDLAWSEGFTGIM